MEFEMRMRAGAYKLMVASTKKEQVLDASRSLLTCNARIKAYMTEAQKRTGHQDFRRLEDHLCFQRICCWEYSTLLTVTWWWFVKLISDCFFTCVFDYGWSKNSWVSRFWVSRFWVSRSRVEGLWFGSSPQNFNCYHLLSLSVCQNYSGLCC